jgi:Secretion system C-terminal sorting domain/Cleaved Adhesin Domain
MKFPTFLFCLLFIAQMQAQTSILNTDFQSGIPSNYTLLNIDAQAPHPQVLEYASGWITVADPENNLDTVAAVSSYFENADTANRWLITPALALGSFGNFISWEAKSHDPSFPDDYLVLVSTTTNDPAAFTDTIGSVQEENFEWTFREANLSAAGYNDSTIYIAFVLRTYDGFKLYLDDISVRKDDPVGFAEKPLITFDVYPNPSKDVINIQVSQDFQRIELTSTNGQLLRATDESSMNINDLKPGPYFLTIYSNGQRHTKRIIKI